MARALWDEIQRRYGFTADDPFDPTAFAGRVGAFWVALDEGRAVGSIALSPLNDPLDNSAAELDVMYVEPGHRRAGVGQALLAALEEHARAIGVSCVRLRAGEPQSEALRFYDAAGFTPIPPFGRWIGDDTARCFEKSLESNR